MLYKEGSCSMKIERKIKRVIENMPKSDKIRHYDKIYKNNIETSKESNLPSLDKRHVSDDLKNLKYLTSEGNNLSTNLRILQR